jgi:hypothetical protein
LLVAGRWPEITETEMAARGSLISLFAICVISYFGFCDFAFAIFASLRAAAIKKSATSRCASSRSLRTYTSIQNVILHHWLASQGTGGRLVTGVSAVY